MLRSWLTSKSTVMVFLFCASGFCQTVQTTSFQVPDSTSTVALGINNSADIVGYYVASGAELGFLLSQGAFHTIACPNASFTIARGINDGGLVVGWCNPSGPGQGFIYQNGNFTYLSYPGSTLTVLLGVNNLGDVVGAYQVQGGQQYGFVYKDSVFKTLGTSRSASGINQSETIAANLCGSHCHGIVKTKTKRSWTLAQKVYYPGAKSTTLGGLNDNGDLCGAWGPTPDGDQEGFVYLKETDQFVGFDIQHSPDMAVAGINNSRQFVGFYAIGTTLYGFYGNVSQ